MATYTFIIDDSTNKTKHLIGLIKELAEIEQKHIQMEYHPNVETVKALEEAKSGQLIKTKNKVEFFSKLND